MARHGIPTAGYRNFTELDAALAYIRERGAPIVVKADGLAAGKGVVVATTWPRHKPLPPRCCPGRASASAGTRIVVEDYLAGEEASFIVVTDGDTVLPLATSQDHKARDEGDTGPEHGRHGRLLAGAGRDAGRRARDRGAGDPTDARGHAGRGHQLHGLPVCRPDDPPGRHARR